MPRNEIPGVETDAAEPKVTVVLAREQDLAGKTHQAEASVDLPESEAKTLVRDGRARLAEKPARATNKKDTDHGA